MLPNRPSSTARCLHGASIRVEIGLRRVGRVCRQFTPPRATPSATPRRARRRPPQRCAARSAAPRAVFYDAMDELNQINQMFIALDDIEALRRLIEQGGDVNATLGDHMTLLWVAVTKRRAEVIELLLESGAEPSLENQDVDGWRPLHLACTHDTLPCVPALLAAGVDVNAKTNDGLCPLHLLSDCSDLKISASVGESLLKCGAHPDVPGPGGHTPLLYAIVRNNRDLAKILLRAGAKPVDIRRRHTVAAFRHLLDGVKAAGDWKQWCSKHRRVLSGLVAKLAPRPGKPGPQRAGRARRAVARPFPLDAASHVVSFLCPEGGF